MISQLEIHAFKRFHQQAFALSPLTILAGLNGSGKTSFIHALLLTWEASIGTSRNIVRLNEPFGMELGNAEDIRNWESNDSIEFHITSAAGGLAIWKFGVPSEEALYLNIEAKPDVLPTAFSGQPRAFSYLCAERLGPRNILGASPLPPHEIEVGVHGENCAQMLATIGDKVILEKDRLHPDSEKDAPSLLKYEVERWLGQIARPVEIETVPYPGSSVTALRFRTPGGDWVRAPNMGFGVSYALPIILAGLTARPGGLLIVENPEAHLHPAGQSRMGTFLAWLAGLGVQIIVETHSDHVLNGVRRAIGEHGYLAHDNATVHFFESLNGVEPMVHRLGFTAIGGVSDWPRGFFDQYQIDVASLGRIRRRS